MKVCTRVQLAAVPKISTKSSLYRKEEDAKEVASEMYIVRIYVWGKSLKMLVDIDEDLNEIDSVQYRGIPQ